jgi:hypothetical protein
VRRAGPLLAAAVVIVANVVALAGVARNRAGRPEAEALLTERELPLAVDDESTGVFLQLQWSRSALPTEPERPWLDRARLESLGLRCSRPAEAEDEKDCFRRNGPRRAYVVLEYDGPAWAGWRAAREASGTRIPVRSIESASRLVPIDAGLDADELRRAHPDRSHTLVVPAILSPWWIEKGPGGEAVLSARVHPLVSRVHVPKNLAARLAALRAADLAGKPPRYEVLLRYGSRHEPWVADLRLIP